MRITHTHTHTHTYTQRERNSIEIERQFTKIIKTKITTIS